MTQQEYLDKWSGYICGLCLRFKYAEGTLNERDIVRRIDAAINATVSDAQTIPSNMPLIMTGPAPAPAIRPPMANGKHVQQSTQGKPK